MYTQGEDARSAMMLYRLKMREWEDSVKAIRALQIAAFKTKLTGIYTLILIRMNGLQCSGVCICMYACI
jgi:hypothetical protein